MQFKDIEIVNNEAEQKKMGELFEEDKYVLLYFSANWCHPCHIFTDKLKRFYSKYHDDVNIVFVSSDSKEAEYNKYFSEMDWWAIPFENIEDLELQGKYEVTTIPTLIKVDQDGDIIDKDFKEKVRNYLNE